MLNDVRNLLEEVELTLEKSAAARFSGFATDFERLDDSFQVIRRLQLEADRTQAYRFNLFQWLDIEYAEDAHTRIVANLLNPRGTHGQGNLFLARFLSQFPALFGETKEVPAGADVVVTQEENSAYGRTDIRIASRALSLAIIIENKIRAEDQAGQLARYRVSLDRGFKDRRTRVLMYLTPSGRRSGDPTAANVNYVPISYNEDIAAWLNSCADEVPARAVCEFVRHYAKIAANLERNAMDDPFESQVVELLERHIESASIVYRDFPKLVRRLELRFWSNLDALLREQLTEFAEWFCDFDKARVSEKADVLFIKPVRDKGSRLCCAISMGQGTPDARQRGLLYLGVQWIGTGPPPWEDSRVAELAQDLANAGVGNSEKSSNWIRYKYLDVELHAPATLKQIAEGDHSTERLIADAAIDLLSKLQAKILEATAAAR